MMQATTGTTHRFEAIPPSMLMPNRLNGDQGNDSLEYQDLKFTLHRKLLDRINLETLSTMAGERMRVEVRVAVAPAGGVGGEDPSQPRRKRSRHR